MNEKRARTPTVWTSLTIILATVFAAAGCVDNTVVQANSRPAERVSEAIAEEELLDIGIGIFDPGIPQNASTLKKEGINPAIRVAEAKYLPYNLRLTLEDTGNWGVVRVIPKDTEAVDLFVTGSIRVSDGELLGLHVEAYDSTGRQWLDENYEDRASRFAYDERHPVSEDPFQDIYNRIADDLLAARRELTAEELRKVRETAKLRFAADLAPAAFGEHLDFDPKKGRYEIVRLAADDDQMLARVYKIREREYMFIDLLDEHYEGFHNTLTQAYGDWRRFSYDEMIELRRLQKSAGQRMLVAAAVIGTSVAVSSEASSSTSSQAANAGIMTGVLVAADALRMSRRAEIQAAAVKELGDSFAAESTPLVVEVEGQTVTLTGTAEAQFDEWRRILRDIYQAETGFEAPASATPPGRL